MTLVKINPAVKDPSFPFLSSHFFRGLEAVPSASPLPAVNIFETDQAFEIHLFAPGRKKEEFTIELYKDILSVSAHEKPTADQELKKKSRLEFSFPSFQRTFNLPDLADRNALTAEYLDGILMVKIGKKAQPVVEVTKIEIH